jgi:transposase
MQTYAGIDLHSSNCYLAVIDEQQRRLYSKRLPNSLDHILTALQPFKEELSGVVVESTYNWYWLVDGLQEQGYRMHLANPSAIRQYEGLKHTDDKWDAFWLAQLLLLGILPQGYIYPKAERPSRDLLRRRLLFVRHRTAHILSLQSMVQRCCGHGISGNAIKKLTPQEAAALFSDPQLGLTARFQVETIGFLTQQIRSIEKAVLPQVKLRPEFEILLTIDGIGKILALTIMLEVGDIRRFAKAGNYASYCRCVKSQKLSDTKKKGEGNRKNGNRYLSWAYVEAANFTVRHSARAKAFYQRKCAKTKKVVAIKALANKLARASFYILRDQSAFDEKRLYG